MTLLWGVDLGGTKIEGVVLQSASASEPLCRVRIDTEGHLGYEHVLDRIADLVDLMCKEVKQVPRIIGFGTPGVLDPQLQVMKNCNSTCLNGQPLKTDLAKKLKVEPRLANDANCFALAETLFGAARGASSVFGIILGTGTGGGVVIGGKVLTGLQGIAGEWGHNVFNEAGGPCYCGKRGCVETYLSGPAQEKAYTQLTGNKKSLKEIAASYKSREDEAANEVLHNLCKNFGKAVAVVINILDPEVVVLGGGVSNIELLYTQGVEELKKHVFNNRLETKVLKNQLGDSAGVFGAALLALL